MEIEEDEENLRIHVKYKIRYSWEYRGKEYSDTQICRKTFKSEKELDISKVGKGVYIVYNWEDAANAIAYSLDIDGNCYRWKSKGVRVSYEKYDAGSWSSSDGMLFGNHDERSYESRKPNYGEREVISLEEVPEEVRNNKEWAPLEKLVVNGGREYRDKLIREYRVTEWERIKKEADEYIKSIK